MHAAHQYLADVPTQVSMNDWQKVLQGPLKGTLQHFLNIYNSAAQLWRLLQTRDPNTNGVQAPGKLKFAFKYSCNSTALLLTTYIAKSTD